MIQQAERNPVTTILAVGSLAAFAADLSGRSVGHLTLNPWTFEFQPWTLLTTIFPHGGIIHLVFNLWWIWPLGCGVESRIGSLRFGLLALACAVTSMGSEVFLGNTAIGMSGVVYGVATFAYFRGKHDPRFRGVIPNEVKNILVAWFFVCIALTYMDVLRVANVAHFMGAAAGWALGQRRRWVPLVLIGLVLVLVTGRPLVRPYNPYKARFNVGRNLYASGDYRGAAEHYARFVKDHPREAGAWWNLSLAQARLGDRRAEESRARAIRLEPDIVHRD